MTITADPIREATEGSVDRGAVDRGAVDRGAPVPPATPAPVAPGAAAARRARRRLAPLYISSWVVGINLWGPVEKLFLRHIGFDAATIGVLAATYAAIVPFLEIPSGILADRWSRRGVLIMADIALGASTLVGGLSTDVPTYLVAALLLGAYFALHSGTVDSIVYDVLVEETGSGAGFERMLGRLQAAESAALASSALAGAAVAQLWSPRVTYFLTVPFVVVAILVLGRLREPQLHRAAGRGPWTRQVAATYRTFVGARRLRPVIATLVLTGVLLQSLLEFGPLWLVALGAPAALFGPQWAGLMAAPGAGGVLAGRLPLRAGPLVAVVAMMLGAATALAISADPAVIIGAQVGLAAVLVAITTTMLGRLHDEVPAALRSGVSSGVGTLQWVAFLPCSLGFGFVTRSAGIHAAAWILVAGVGLTGGSLVRLAAGGRTDGRPE